MKKIAIWGSCVSRDPFRTNYNKNWHDSFEIKLDYQRHSLITITKEKINIDKKQLTILPENKSNNFRTRVLQNEFDRTFINDLKEQEIDYLIMDMNFEAQMGILKFEDKIITHDYIDIYDTPFIKKIKQYEIINMENNPNEYYKLWTQACEKFFKKIKKTSPKLKIILNEMQLIEKYYTKNKTIKTDEQFIKRAKKYNPIIKKFEKHIKENYKVKTIPFDETIIGDENHIWGKHTEHYQKEYYTNFYKKLCNIIEKDTKEKTTTETTISD